MATQPQKKNAVSSSQKRKKPVKKSRPQKQSDIKKKNEDTFKKSLFIVSGVLLMISMVAFGYFLGQNDMLKTVESTVPTYTVDAQNGKKQLLQDLSNLETQKPEIKKYETKKSESQNSVTKKEDRERKVRTLEKDTSVKPLHQVRVKEIEEKPKIIKKVPKVEEDGLVKKPKLVIIIDDVATARQLKKIQALKMNITPSIFPPSERSMKSHTLARGLKHYMIHLPMESGSKQFNKQYKTLKTTFTKEQIVARAKELRQLFPTAKVVNNHTGSVFTNDYKSMLILYTALKKEGFMFMDSRTIASTKVPKIAKKFGDAYMARDVFIDNVHNVKTIHKQLRKAVEVAKKRGHAVAIGHPHDITMKALSRAGIILKDVELVYIDNLMTI